MDVNVKRAVRTYSEGKLFELMAALDAVKRSMEGLDALMPKYDDEAGDSIWTAPTEDEMRGLWKAGRDGIDSFSHGLLVRDAELLAKELTL
ncbi:hypothetical protein [Stackebrandtia soli]|uniref:hypothetical protein n=1 Tax=Stackebrandtia soli TaxID=1892856 RepID=UPI0039EC59F5